MLYESDLPFGIDEVSEEELKKCANIVARTIVEEYISASGGKPSKQIYIPIHLITKNRVAASK